MVFKLVQLFYFENISLDLIDIYFVYAVKFLVTPAILNVSVPMPVMSTKKEKTVSFNSDTMSSKRTSESRPSSTLSRNSGYSSNNMYWGFNSGDVFKAQQRLR